MSIARTHGLLELPQSLRDQLREFRGRVWSVKTIEAACAAAFGVAVAFLLMYGLDRIWDTPRGPRGILFGVAAVACACIPLALYRWVWRHRRLEQLARLLARKHPRVGDQLLGVIELVHSESEQSRSRALCEAAINQVAEDARKRDLRDAVPNPRHLRWAAISSVGAAFAFGLAAFYPAAAANAWARLLAPWKAIPRYTFAAVEPMPDRIVVPHGEPFTIAPRLTDETVWHPAQGVARIGTQQPVAARLRDGRYEFAMPPQISPGRMRIDIGDAVRQVRLEPTLRPELTSVVADVTLPEYLGLPQPQRKDVRGGAISLVKGSRVRLAATANRELASATVDDRPAKPSGATVAGAPIPVDATRKVVFSWRDRLGLSGKEPFSVAINGRDDEPPTVACEDLPRQRVVLDSELLSFKVRAQDDFGICKVGLEWRGIDEGVVSTPAEGEKVLAAGGNDKASLELAGTFSAKSLGIDPQPVNLRIFVEDYLPGRPRVYSPTYTLYVLDPEQHAIWLTEQLSKWHRQSLEVRDREMQLLETNKQLRDLPQEELDRPETRRRIENQAAAERANGRRLSGLVSSGEDLVQQAMRNPEFGVGHLEKWAEMLQVLKDISSNRMPSVADLLDQGARAPVATAKAASNRAPMAGQIRSSAAGAPAKPPEGVKTPNSAVPSVVDQESSQQPAGKASPKATAGAPKPPRLTLPVTTLSGSGKPNDSPPPPAGQKLEEAVVKQQELLAEFEKVAEELNRILANLEGSTLVKRLKAASRLQYKLAGRIGGLVGQAFGRAAVFIEDEPAKVLGEIASAETKGSEDVSLIMDDMQSYFERRRYLKFKTVLDEMKEQDVVGGLRQIADDVKKESGLSIAQCEFWSDTLDRWAEDLVDPSNCGACPGSKSRSSLPPSIVLEVLQILEAEVNLREETRVAEQAKPAVTSQEHADQAHALSETQEELRVRVEKVIGRIRELPDAETEFAYEIGLLGQVEVVMGEAVEILDRPETGRPAIGAETDAIELLLQSRRINPKRGGGGGSNPGGGGGGQTQDSAMALLGGGVNEKEVREDHMISQATGDSGPTLPEEFRAGLDEYFNRLERSPGGR
jgi:hypothetical protein